jgi:hypothetical protein
MTGSPLALSGTGQQEPADARYCTAIWSLDAK